NPDFHQALQNKAHVLSEHLNRPEEAMAVLDTLVERYPGYVKARVGRGVLRARQGRRAEAHDDAREALARDRTALTLYQVANIYALTSRQEARDADRAIPLMCAALALGFGLDVIDGDTDMDPVRDLPGFRRALDAFRELQREAGR